MKRITADMIAEVCADWKNFESDTDHVKYVMKKHGFCYATWFKWMRGITEACPKSFPKRPASKKLYTMEDIIDIVLKKRGDC